MLIKCLLFASAASATCLHGLSKFKRAEGEGAEIKKFGYTGADGPLNWASLGPENEACKIGGQQSPINIQEDFVKATEAPLVTIPDDQVPEFENLGTTIEVVVNGTTSFAGADFNLVQFHMHTPSEHRIGQEYFPLEAHFVHQAAADENQIAVISVLFQLSTEASDPLLAGLQPLLTQVTAPGSKVPIEGGLDFSNLINHVQTTPLFQYVGSLTTPPCSEGVTFLVAEQPLAIDVNTFNEIKSIVKFNSRFTQNDLTSNQNLIEVAQRAGTAEQIEPPILIVSNATATPTVVQAAEVTKGQTITLTEISGQPTSLVAVIAKRERRHI